MPEIINLKEKGGFLAHSLGGFVRGHSAPWWQQHVAEGDIWEANNQRTRGWAPQSPSQVPIDPISFHRLQLFKVLTLPDSATGSGPSL